ncbi:MAG TPA: hypothetical protein VER35_01020, partial [Candidatus Limnocylindrales bacterium]|nr:hypothetical protein [Candidatus Limnocylindrales bacterium]
RMEDNQDVNDRYSRPCYYDKEQKIWVDDSYNPIELPDTLDLLHGGETGFDCRTDEDLNDVPNRLFHDKIEKYKGIQFRDNLSIAVFQSFKSEWKAYVLSTRLPKAQQTRQLLSRGLAGKAIVVVSQRFGKEIANIEADTILNFLEEKVSAHLGVLGKMDLMKKVKQDVNDESLISFYRSTPLFKQRQTKPMIRR